MSDEDLVKLIEGMRKFHGVELVGECKRCGKCCEGGTKTYLVDEDNHKLLYKGRTGHPCKIYDPEKKTCSGHGTTKPAICRMFPYLPDSILAGDCGFSFKKIIEGGQDADGHGLNLDRTGSVDRKVLLSETEKGGVVKKEDADVSERVCNEDEGRDSDCDKRAV